ncbi:hypothetical protein GALMADRAFT_55255, partial [Galerina marginata CBS 339.88]
VAYKQFYITVVVDSRQENARFEDIKPKRTPDSDMEEKQSSSSKTGRTRGMTAGLTLGPHPQVVLTGATTNTTEETTGFEWKRYKSGITEDHGDGIVLWGFNVDDLNLQKQGTDIREEVLPTWSMILPSESKGTWIRKLLGFVRPSGKAQTPSYSNIFQMVALTTVPSDLPELSHYRAKLEVRSGTSGPPDIRRRAVESVNVTPAVVDGTYITLLVCGLKSNKTNIFRLDKVKILQSPNDCKL